jgi:RNA-splicing ligase RtcB
MPFIYKWLAVMPDVHVGIGATIGTVLPTKEAIIPAAVGVDIGCGMMAVQTTWGRWEQAITLLRCALMRPIKCGLCCIQAHVA